jgi:hypothetical protein
MKQQSLTGTFNQHFSESRFGGKIGVEVGPQRQAQKFAAGVEGLRCIQSFHPGNCACAV